MIEFVLYVYLGSRLYNDTQIFDNIDRCRYFAERLSEQRSVPQPDGTQKKINGCVFTKG